MKFRIFFLILILLCLISFSCKKNLPTTSDIDESSSPIIVNFISSSPNVLYGDSVVLSWQVNNATSIELVALNLEINEEEKEVINSFELIINSIDKFFSASPIVLASEFSLGSKVLEEDGTWKGRRTREAINIYYLLKFEKLEIGYDIQKTASIITPYIGYIVISLWIKSNASYGNVNDGKYNWGFRSAEDANKINKFSSCVSDPNYPVVAWCYGDIKLSYAYQKDKWIFKGIDTETPNKIRKTRVREILSEIILKNPEWEKAIKKE